jgi:hypothetical protein
MVVDGCRRDERALRGANGRRGGPRRGHYAGRGRACFAAGAAMYFVHHSQTLCWAEREQKWERQSLSCVTPIHAASGPLFLPDRLPSHHRRITRQQRRGHLRQ